MGQVEFFKMHFQRTAHSSHIPIYWDLCYYVLLTVSWSTKIWTALHNTEKFLTMMTIISNNLKFMTDKITVLFVGK